jgi:glutamine synthetase type III
MTVLSTYLPILTLNFNGFNSPIKHINWQTGLKRKTNILLHKGDIPHQQKQALAESERLEED